MAYGDFKELPTRTATDKVLGDKVFNIAKNPKYHAYQRGLHWFVTVLIKNLLVVVLKVKLCKTKN